MKKTLLFLTVILFLFSCENDDSSDNNNIENDTIDNPTENETLEDGTMKALIDGELWISDSLEPSNLIKYIDDWQILEFGGKSESFTIYLSITEPTKTECVSEEKIVGVHPLDQVINTEASLYQFEENNTIIRLSYKEETDFDSIDFEKKFISDFELTITKCEENKVSGIFSGTFYSSSEDEEPITIKDGEFKNIPFENFVNTQFGVFGNQ